MLNGPDTHAMPEAAAELSPLQQRVAREVVALVRRENRRAGDHLPEVHLAQQIGTSRSPVQAALRHLARMGVLQQLGFPVIDYIEYRLPLMK